MTQKLDGVDWRHIEIVSDGEDNVFCYRVRKRDTGEILYAVWWDWFRESGGVKESKIAGIAEKNSFLATEVVPNEKHHSRSFPLHPKNGVLSIPLTKSPVILQRGSPK